MTTDNPSHSLTNGPLLSQEMERTLHQLAWKDDDFRAALIADPKGVIQQVFYQSLPNGKLPDNLTIKIVEEDPFTYHIVIPALADEVPAPAKTNTSQIISQLPPLREEVGRILRLRAWEDETFYEELIADPKSVLERLFPECFPNGKAPEQMTYKVIEQDSYTHHIVLPTLPDQFWTLEVPEEEQLELIANMGRGFCEDLATRHGNGCDGTGIHDPNCSGYQCNGSSERASQRDRKREREKSDSLESKSKKPHDFMRLHYSKDKDLEALSDEPYASKSQKGKFEHNFSEENWE